MAGVNKVIIIGNLGNDPEVKYMPNGDAVANISVATSDQWKDKQTGERRERTEWHRIVMFRRLGEIAGEYLRKGSKVYIEGKLQTRKWQGQDGQDRYTTEIIADQMQMLDSRQGAGTADMSNNYGSAPSAAPRPSNQGGGGSQSGQSPQQPPSNYDDFEDDIPF